MDFGFHRNFRTALSISESNIISILKQITLNMQIILFKKKDAFFFNNNSTRVRTRKVFPSCTDFFKFCLYCITGTFVFNIFGSVHEQFFRAIISGIVFLTYFSTIIL